ncbi:transmembrane protein 114-like [Ptychodera flava]|uniref:transmembrane protein 114-like n=1 Tax=Ptychodera flava TaxID=63121 RepID=UPI003969E548
MSTKDWHPYTKYIIALSILGTLAFLFVGIGSATDFWITSRQENSTGHIVESHSGLWRVCYKQAEPQLGYNCVNLDLKNVPEKGSPGYNYLITMFALKSSSLLSIVLGMFLIFFGELVALFTLKIRRKSWFVAAGSFFLFGGFFILGGLCVYITMVLHESKWWPDELGSPPEAVVKFSWSFALEWVGITLSFIVGGTYVWLSRLYVEDML